MSSSRVQKSFPSRSNRRLAQSAKISLHGFLSLLSCSRCLTKGLSCICIKSGFCSECVRSGMSGKCNAEGYSKVDRVLMAQRKEFDKALEESALAQEAAVDANRKAAAASAKAARLAKVVRSLESRSKEELDEIMKEVEKENDNGEGSSGGNDGGVSDGFVGNERNVVSSGVNTDPLSVDAWMQLPTEAVTGSGGGIDELFGDSPVSVLVPMSPFRDTDSILLGNVTVRPYIPISEFPLLRSVLLLPHRRRLSLDFLLLLGAVAGYIVFSLVLVLGG